MLQTVEFVEQAAHADGETALPEGARVYKLASAFDLRRRTEQQVLHEHLNCLVAMNARAGKSALVTIVSVDRYTRIEAMFGSEACDALFRHLVQRLVRRAGRWSSAARVRDDQLIMWMLGLESESQAEAAVAKMRAACATPFTQCSMCFYLTMSMGVAVSPQDGTDASTLMACATSRMQREKRAAEQRNYTRLTGRCSTQLAR
jgi:diguanylate cyclase (GGDEF)-like protein